MYGCVTLFISSNEILLTLVCEACLFPEFDVEILLRHPLCAEQHQVHDVGRLKLHCELLQLHFEDRPEADSPILHGPSVFCRQLPIVGASVPSHGGSCRELNHRRPQPQRTLQGDNRASVPSYTCTDNDSDLFQSFQRHDGVSP